jgi:acid phosphatase
MPPIRQVTAVLAFFCTLALFAIIWSYSASDQKPPKSLNPDPSKQFVAPYGTRPLSPTWKQWFYPGAWSEGRLEAQRAGKVDKDWNVYYHVGGNGPWIPKVDGIVTNDTGPPQGCTVQQVHMVCDNTPKIFN